MKQFARNLKNQVDNRNTEHGQCFYTAYTLDSVFILFPFNSLNGASPFTEHTNLSGVLVSGPKDHVPFISLSCNSSLSY